MFFRVTGKRQASGQTGLLQLEFAAFLCERARVAEARGEAIAYRVATNAVALPDISAIIYLCTW
jgi:hypothetical protein